MKPTKPCKTWILVTLAAAGLVIAPNARAWVAVRAGPAFFGAAAVGVAAGAVAGAAVASAAAPQPVYVAPPPPPPPPVVGTIVTALPPGCVASGSRYQCGAIFYQPYFGSSGVYYQVVAP